MHNTYNTGGIHDNDDDNETVITSNLTTRKDSTTTDDATATTTNSTDDKFSDHEASECAHTPPNNPSILPNQSIVPPKQQAWSHMVNQLQLKLLPNAGTIFDPTKN